MNRYIMQRQSQIRSFRSLNGFIKMGLYKLAAHLINEYHDGAFGYESRNGVRGLRKNGKTIFGILALQRRTHAYCSLLMEISTS